MTYMFSFLGFLKTVSALLVLLYLASCLPVGKHSPHCEVSKTARSLIWHLLPMSATLGGKVHSSYTKIVSFVTLLSQGCVVYDHQFILQAVFFLSSLSPFVRSTSGYVHSFFRSLFRYFVRLFFLSFFLSFLLSFFHLFFPRSCV